MLKVIGRNCNYSNELLMSLLTVSGEFGNVEDVLEWTRNQNKEVEVDVSKIAFKDLVNWDFQEDALRHSTGKFFSIDGIEVSTNYGNVKQWNQPIINQPEIGILGFLTKKIGGILYFLIQAKIEPGNLNYVQLSPTLQATKSNYTQVHDGKVPDYLKYFQQAKSSDIILDQLQSEQGARFLKKRNRNIVIQVDEEVELKSNYMWVTLGQIKELMRFDNVVNMDTRTVISGLPIDELFVKSTDISKIENLSALGKDWIQSYTELLDSENSLSSLISKVTGYKSRYDLYVRKISLKKLKDWNVGKYSISHTENKFFEVIAAKIKIDNREVVEWTQPLIRPKQGGICAFIVKKINGIMHFLVQAKLECGNFDVIEFAPSIQCLTGDFDNDNSRLMTPYLDYVLKAKRSQFIYDSYQSEEGGRFYKEQNRNSIVLADDNFEENLQERYEWMTLSQLQRFVQFNNYINIQARSLIASLTFIDND